MKDLAVSHHRIDSPGTTQSSGNRARSLNHRRAKEGGPRLATKSFVKAEFVQFFKAKSALFRGQI